MFTLNVDLGQLITTGMIGIVGYFVKRTIDKFEIRLDRHEEVIFKINGDIQAIIGSLGIERRKSTRA